MTALAIELIRIEAPIEDIGNMQMACEPDVDADLGFKPWGGKDSQGNVTKFLAKGKASVVKSERITDLIGQQNKNLQVDAVGNIIAVEPIYDESLVTAPISSANSIPRFSEPLVLVPGSLTDTGEEVQSVVPFSSAKTIISGGLNLSQALLLESTRDFIARGTIESGGIPKYGTQGVNRQGYFVGDRVNGTFEDPTALLGNDLIVSFLALGYDGVGPFGRHCSEMQYFADENWTETSRGSRIDWAIIKKGTITQVVVMSLKTIGNIIGLALDALCAKRVISTHQITTSMSPTFDLSLGTTLVITSQLSSTCNITFTNAEVGDKATILLKQGATEIKAIILRLTSGQFVQHGYAAVNSDAIVLLGYSVLNGYYEINITFGTDKIWVKL